METRTYNCRDEELSVIAGYVLSQLKRDAADFAAFSPKFDESYLAAFESKIAEMSEAASPRKETLELKILTERLYRRMDDLIEPIARVEGYLKMAKKELPFGVKDFGLSQLRYEIRTRDAAGILTGLQKLNEMLNVCKAILSKHGLQDALIEVFPAAAKAILDDDSRQCEIVAKRKQIVENNLRILNELYSRITEICNVGKILHKGNGESKDYTFTELKKKVKKDSGFRNQESGRLECGQLDCPAVLALGS
ncbi:MAG: hypothetical protein LBC98_00655 [Prevotellaceae bacterium]|jgi:hypothetical protein|nr:hypothetical protein [Prevotellaceae bacterium]